MSTYYSNVPPVRHVLDISDHHRQSGQLLGGAIVRRGGHLDLSGQSAGPLTIGDGGFARISGQTHGPVIVHAGGMARISGQVHGEIHNHGHIRLTGQFHGRIVENTGRLEAAVGTGFFRGSQLMMLAYDGSLVPPPSVGVMIIDDEFTEWLIRQPDGTFSRPEPSAS